MWLFLLIGAVNKDMKRTRKKFGDNHFHNILRLLMFYQIFLSPQVKRSTTFNKKHGIYELSHELPNDLRLRISGK